MTITAETTLRQAAFIVCTELHHAGTTAVLTGGSAATVWSGGAYQSHDCDFVIAFNSRDSRAEEALKRLGYREKNGTYVHLSNQFTLEFPRGPLSVGDDIVTKWSTLREKQLLLHILSPTDSCRDRLAAYYHWNDFPSLTRALEIAGHSQIDLEVIREWSFREGHPRKFAQFERMLV